jgi:hypothetical protein
MATSISTVAFAFLDPETLRIFLELKQFHVRVASGDMTSLGDLQVKQQAQNIVILPNFAKRYMLVDYVDRIGVLVLLTNGKHAEILERGIPLLDAVVSDEDVVADRARTPHWYIDKIMRLGRPLELDTVAGAASQPKKTVTKEGKPPQTVDKWLDYINKNNAKGIHDFAVDIEYPVCLYLVGESNRLEFQGALKALTKRGADKKLLRGFYTWLTEDYVQRMQRALKLLLFPKSTSKIPDVFKLAKKLDLASKDIELMAAVYGEMQGATDEQEEEE